MNATAYSGHSRRKPMKLNALTDNSAGSLRYKNSPLNIPMNIYIPEFHLFSHAQPKPTKGHRADRPAALAIV
jgi:hypothetical protein